MGEVVYVNFRGEDPRELFAQADKLDENPATLREALKLYTRAVQLDPLFGEAWVNLGNVYFRLNDAANARLCYERGIRACAGGSAEAYYNAGYVDLSEGRYRQAIEKFEASVKLDPLFADAHYNLGLAWERLGLKEPAKACFRCYLQLPVTEDNWAVQARLKIETL